jgi:hypothetical protein
MHGASSHWKQIVAEMGSTLANSLNEILIRATAGLAWPSLAMEQTTSHTRHVRHQWGSNTTRPLAFGNDSRAGLVAWIFSCTKVSVMNASFYDGSGLLDIAEAMPPA